MSETASPAGATEKPPVEREIASVKSDPNRWFYGDRTPLSDPIIASRGGSKGLALYDELLRDPQVGCEMGKRIAALVGREWSVTVGSEDPRAEVARALVERALSGARFNQAVEKLLGALMKGIGIGEVMWRREGREVLVQELRGRNPQRFSWGYPDGALEPQLRLLTRENRLDGVPVPPMKFVVHRFGAQYEDPWGLGLGSRLFWPVYFKRQGVGFWLSALEKFGQPTAVGKYPSGSTDAEIAKLLAVCQAVASEAGVVIPEGMVVELVEAKRSGTFESYEQLARYMDEDISKIILGGTLTTSTNGVGSQALGNVHNEVRLEITKGDADLLSDTLNGGLVRWIVDLNLPGYAATRLPYPGVWWDVSEPEDLVARAKRDKDVRELGYRPTEDYVRETYGEGWGTRPAAGAAQPRPAGGPRHGRLCRAGAAPDPAGRIAAGGRRSARRGRHPRRAAGGGSAGRSRMRWSTPCAEWCSAPLPWRTSAAGLRSCCTGCRRRSMPSCWGGRSRSRR